MNILFCSCNMRLSWYRHAKTCWPLWLLAIGGVKSENTQLPSNAALDATITLDKSTSPLWKWEIHRPATPMRHLIKQKCLKDSPKILCFWIFCASALEYVYQINGCLEEFCTEWCTREWNCRRGLKITKQITELAEAFTMKSFRQSTNGDPVFAVFIDFSSAFDMVNHQKTWTLLTKRTSSTLLRFLKGMHETAKNWIKRINKFTDFSLWNREWGKVIQSLACCSTFI